MPASSDTSYDDEQPAVEPTADDPTADDPTRSRAAVLPTGDLAGAERALDQAEDVCEAAQDALADLEGRIAVLESKDAAAGLLEEGETAIADLQGRIGVLEAKVDAVEADDSKQPWQLAAAREDLAKAERALELERKKLARGAEQLEAKAREELAKARRAFRRAGTKLSRAEERRDTAAAQVEAEKQAIREAIAAGLLADAEAPPQPRFATVDLFVERFVLPNWVHRYVSKSVRWCDHWWEHAEAITRLEAIWEAFEVMRLQPAPSFSTWLRDHFDVHMRTLTDPDGAFHECDWKEVVHRTPDPWSTTAVPEGMFAVIEAAQIQRGLAPGLAHVAEDASQLVGRSAGNDVMQAAYAPAATTHEPTTHHTSHTTSGATR